ncbi:AAA family ATPase [Streptomyces gamaensis]|uniref:Nuclease SbcCD subunit C n=1 Tax=Streptomyces gamaensis TaxID=1763542 RepID=A0ABW0Z3N1_9ACTN
MRLHRLTVTAFGPFGATQHVDFDTLSAAGLFLLHGPTGAGKTSVLDAVCYALYGAVPGARESGPTLRSDHAAPGTATEVRLEFTAGGRRLEITRRPEHYRPKKRGEGLTRERAVSELREWRPGSDRWDGLSRSHQEIGEEILQLIGMSRDQFCQVVLLPQGEFARFLRAEDSARGKLLGKLFDTGRFAAVEEHLAELRRASEKQVAAADAQLTGLAHRMAQAAGRGPDADALPLPAGTGTPVPRQRAGARTARTADRQQAPAGDDLAEAVLSWAAVARTVAREQRDIAAVALETADQASRAAQQHAQDVHELAGLQQQFAEARQRAATLEAQRPEHDRVRTRLERARAAAPVTLALGLRDSAAHAHQEALAAEQDARRPLPPEHATATTAQLAALERSLREELGELAAARRTEERAAALTAERAALSSEAAADAAALAAAEDWLAGWDERRAAAEQRVEAAHAAATRAARLEGETEPARRRLAAARERDRLTGGLSAAEAALLAAREAAATAREHWLGLRERRLRGVAAELADALADGAPCPVCGATGHPAPARPEPGHVEAADEDRAFEDVQRADDARQRAERALDALRDDLARARAEAGDATTAELADAAEETDRALRQARAAAADAPAAREALARAEQDRAGHHDARQAARVRTAARDRRLTAVDDELRELATELTRARGGAGSVAARAALLERRAALVAAATEAARAATDTADALRTAGTHLAEAARHAGFATPRDAAEAALPDSGQQALQERFDAWQREESATAARLADARTAEAARRPPADPAAADARFAAADARLQQARTRDHAARTRCADLDRLSAEALADVRALAPLRTEHRRVTALANLAAGTSAHNERKMRLESYVLAARLEQVAAAATVRLRHLSDGRYTLVHSDARSGTRRSGLGLHVVDAWTGRERDTSTLSGGETFFVSLSLALGLADVVTEEAGGVRLDTLFIDEGFGSLDEQTLDEVLDVLDTLRERDRAVGIVSHVADLRRRIPAQLQVLKGRTGSTIRHRTAGA